MGAASGEDSVEVPKTLKVGLPCDPVRPLLGICPKEMKQCFEKTCAPPCSLQLCLQQPRYKSNLVSTTDGWVKTRVWYIHAMGYYTAIERNEVLPFGATWTDLEGVMLSGMSQKGKYVISLTRAI